MAGYWNGGEDPFGYPFGDDEAPAQGAPGHPNVPPDFPPAQLRDPGAEKMENFARWLDQVAPPAAAEYRRAMKAASVGPHLPSPQRFYPSKEQAGRRPVWPTRAIGPDPNLYPGQTTKLRTLHALSEGSTAVSGSIEFNEWTSVYAISAIAHVQNVDPLVDDWSRNLIQLSMAREESDILTPVVQGPAGGANQLVPLSNISGSGERPMPLGGYGWAFQRDNVLTINGIAAHTDWELWITFHLLDFPSVTNYGMIPGQPYGEKRDRE